MITGNPIARRNQLDAKRWTSASLGCPSGDPPLTDLRGRPQWVIGMQQCPLAWTALRIQRRLGCLVCRGSRARMPGSTGVVRLNQRPGGTVHAPGSMDPWTIATEGRESRSDAERRARKFLLRRCCTALTARTQSEPCSWISDSEVDRRRLIGGHGRAHTGSRYECHGARAGTRGARTRQRHRITTREQERLVEGIAA